METYLFKLRFKGATHFGETGIDLENVSERISSDTLFSAIMNAYSAIYGPTEVSEFIDSFREKPCFLLSSLFVYSGNIYFLPKPLYDDHIDKELKRQLGKDLKKLKWIDAEYFLKWLNGNLNKEDIERMLEIQDKYEKAFLIDIRPRVTLDRETNQSTIYHSGYLYFVKNAGLYGFVTFMDSSFITKFKQLLDALGNMGLGGEKTYGCGTFEVIVFEKISDTFRKILYSGKGNYMLLSLYHPSEKEKDSLKDNAISYDIIRKKGWITTGRYALPYKRKSLGFFTEGSVFKNKPIGSLVDVTPENLEDEIPHKIYRYGFAFTIPLGGLS